MTDRFARRRELLRKSLHKEKIPSLLVQRETNVHWLTGFTGEDSILFLDPQREILITDSRFVTQLADECPNLELVVRKTGRGTQTMDQAVARTLKKLGIRSCGCEADTMTVGLRERIDENLKGKLDWVSTHALIENLRAVKDAQEIREIRQAVKIAEEAFVSCLDKLSPDEREIDFAHQLEQAIRNRGGSGHSFEPIVAVGPRAALPHGRASHAKLGENPLLLVDWGARANRYVSDLTRIVITGKTHPKLEKIYRAVLAAQKAAIAKIRPGVECSVVDAAARNSIAAAGFGKYFGHGLGHGIGLDVHEMPRFNTTSTQILEPGMIVTVEPGIYLPGFGGVRLEDDVLVTKDGHEVLSTLPKSWNSTRAAWVT
ncbi:MAG: Xaa-Pro peptidase family protein [Pirellulales bacterium]|nr:Xaa-Pro peptidase family protein [Pirellulales bacterium]